MPSCAVYISDDHYQIQLSVSTGELNGGNGNHKRMDVDVYRRRRDADFSQGALSWPVATSENMPRSSTRHFHSCSLLLLLPLLNLSSDHIHGAAANQTSKLSSRNLGTMKLIIGVYDVQVYHGMIMIITQYIIIILCLL